MLPDNMRKLPLPLYLSDRERERGAFKMQHRTTWSILKGNFLQLGPPAAIWARASRSCKIRASRSCKVVNEAARAGRLRPHRVDQDLKSLTGHGFWRSAGTASNTLGLPILCSVLHLRVFFATPKFLLSPLTLAL